MDRREIQEKRNYMIVKSNDLIQKSRFNLSLQEQKIILYLISKIKPKDMALDEHFFEIQDFCRVCGINDTSGKNYKDVKDAIKSLADKSIWIKLGDRSETEVLLRWINKAWLDKKSGHIRLRLDDDLKPYLLQLQENFTQYELLYILAMKSQYSVRLYEILKSYEYKHKKILFDLDELKKMLFAESYSRYPDFKRYVLDISMREINDFSDLIVSYEVIKERRKYTKIEFSIKIKKDVNQRLQTWVRIDEVINRD